MTSRIEGPWGTLGSGRATLALVGATVKIPGIKDLYSIQLRLIAEEPSNQHGLAVVRLYSERELGIR